VNIETTQKRIQEMIQLLQEIKVENDFMIPMNVLEMVDHGINPDVLRKEQLQTIVDKNQKTHGRLRSIQLFHDELEQQIRSCFPDLLPSRKSMQL
jgi:hypothetical protein